MTRAVVVGAGIFGLFAALGALDAGVEEVVVCDPAPLGRNASGVAAGMLAPLGEVFLDGGPTGLFPTLRRARDLWIPYGRLDDRLRPERAGVVLETPSGSGAASERWRALRALGAAGEGGEAEDGLFRLVSGEDWLIEPTGALEALAALARSRGARFVAEGVPPRAAGDVRVIAAGAGARAFSREASVLADLRPIKGHVLRYPDVRPGGRVRRRGDLYFAPQSSGLVVGATMEAGEERPVVDPAVAGALHARAAELWPELEGRSFTASAGVRAAFEDGLPRIGPAGEGVFLAAGARRNGWLLGPLVAEILVAYLTARPMEPDVRIFRADRP